MPALVAFAPYAAILIAVLVAWRIAEWHSDL